MPLRPAPIVRLRALFVPLALLVAASSAPAEPILHGFRDFYYGDTVNSKPTGEKPESKLWWHDGTWWGSLWNDSP